MGLAVGKYLQDRQHRLLVTWDWHVEICGAD
jgi:hypothetical protein